MIETLLIEKLTYLDLQEAVCRAEKDGWHRDGDYTWTREGPFISNMTFKQYMWRKRDDIR